MFSYTLVISGEILEGELRLFCCLLLKVILFNDLCWKLILMLESESLLYNPSLSQVRLSSQYFQEVIAKLKRR